MIPIAMQKVEGSSPFIRFKKDPLRRVFFVLGNRSRIDGPGLGRELGTRSPRRCGEQNARRASQDVAGRED